MEKEVKRVHSSTLEFVKNNLLKNKMDFELHTTMNTSAIVLDDIIYKSVQSTDRLGGSHLIGMFSKAVDKRLESGFIPPTGLSEPVMDLFQIDNLKNNIDEMVTSIDLKSAYWTAAWKLGYIDSAQYYMNWHQEKWKDGRVAAIGCLNKQIYVDRYVKGELQKENEVIRTEPMKQDARLHIINYVNQFMRKLATLSEESFLMIQTDAITMVTEPKHLRLVFDAIIDEGFRYTIKKLVINEVSNGYIMVESFPEIAPLKKIYFSDRNIFF